MLEAKGDQGEIPSPIAPPSGCAFRTRRPLSAEICTAERPLLRGIGQAHLAACHMIGAGGEAPGVAA